ncbi:hypothetical protein CC78DRAFT_231640 [Lojkania enalia]|uniref:Zn(2)-C6 fungal-type domain-containing protein n=1 Tax=Lojkania enalia TaxID=147567 RepID=A0A9P4K8K2_9PLEO|nr:hypothetical protein CC78DRAFT_231640 [Didymosphaeria enalia]
MVPEVGLMHIRAVLAHGELNNQSDIYIWIQAPWFENKQVYILKTSIMYPSSKETKHIACSRCRERKVRCDGDKPNCRRCVRHGQSCKYVRGRKQQVKNEWVQHLTTFSAQPGRACYSLCHSHPLLFAADP